MNPYGAYANPYGAYANQYGDASAAAGGGFGGVPYAASAANQGWWGVAGYDVSGGAACGAEGDWGAWGGKPSASVNGKGGGGKGGKGDGKDKKHYANDWSYGQGDLRYGGQEGEESDPDMREIQAAFAQVQGEKDADTANMEVLRKAEEEEATADRAAQLRERGASSSGGSDSGDALPPPASEAEIEEARQIVQKAQREAVEREKMKAKAKTASRDDLQAMINARLALK